MRISPGLQSTAYGILGLAAAWLALSIPLHFRAVSPLVLAEAADGTRSLEDAATDYLFAGDTGPARLLLEVSPVRHRDIQERLQAVLREHPLYHLSGGPAPYYEQWLQAAGLSAETTAPEDRTVLSLLLRREHRRHLLSYLEQSSNQTVHALLETRQLTAYQRFLPVFSAAGHPLDATILATALLEQSGAWSRPMSRLIREEAARAPEDPASLARLEDIYLGVLTLGKRSNWRQLEAILSLVESPSELKDLNAAAQLAGERLPELYAASLLSRDPAAVSRYILKRPEEGWAVLAMALDMGEGALHAMASFDSPLYEPPSYIAALPLEPGQQILRDFSERNPKPALGLKTLLLIAGGFGLTRSLGFLVRVFSKAKPAPAARGPALHALHLVSAIAFAGLVWIATEPRLLQFEPNEAANLRIQLAQLVTFSPTESSVSETAMLDQATLLILIFFFLLQVLVFAFSVIKIREIRAYQGSATIKLRLLDNEDNLFDLGLYVGLGGTVSSLIFIVLEFVDASLMAAYSSSVFGIIFVAVLKILVLRPFRRRLILESCGEPADPRQPAAVTVSE